MLMIQSQATFRLLLLEQAISCRSASHESEEVTTTIHDSINVVSMKHSDFTIQVAWLRYLADGAVLFLCDARPQACRPEN